MDKELMAKVSDVDVSIRGIERLLEAAACFPTTDASALLDMLGGIQKLAKSAGEELNEVFDYIMFEPVEEKKEAPESAATETSAKEKLTQVEDTTEPEAKQGAKEDKRIQIITLLKDGKPVREIAEQVGASTAYIYKIKSEVM